jgi:prophage maintenance system killer protein
MQKNEQIVLFNSQDGNVTIDVTVEQDTVWLSQKQIGDLFNKERSVITKHIANIFKDGELEQNQVCAKFAHTAEDGKSYEVDFYNLDVIISVGYRVKSKRGIEFRRWANSVLKDYLLKGYALNRNIIDTKTKEYQNLLDILGKTLVNNQLVDDQGQNIVELITTYANTWTTLLQYDEDRLNLPSATLHKTSLVLDYKHALNAINEFKQKLLVVNEATALFGNERNDHLQSILANLDQTMFGEELYKSAEEKAANLLYMVIKDHPFSDGNKRIGSFLFILYIQINQLPLKIDNLGLTSLALLVAESDPQQKELMVKLIINLISSKI